jgi:hypothetical protein
VNCPNCSCHNCIKDRVRKSPVIVSDGLFGLKLLRRDGVSEESPNGIPDAYRVKNGLS